MAKGTCGALENGVSCGRPVCARGWCQMHYTRWQRHGDLTRGAPQRPKQCSLPDCTGPHYALGWCHKHHMRWRVHGNPEGAPPRPPDPDLPGEHWEPIPNYEELYGVSTMGRLRNLRTGRVLSTPVNGHGYPHAILHRDGQRETVTVHQVMALVFIGLCPPGEMVRHLDDVKTNNVVPNLEYGTDWENKQDAIRNGRTCKGQRKKDKAA